MFLKLQFNVVENAGHEFSLMVWILYLDGFQSMENRNFNGKDLNTERMAAFIKGWNEVFSD